MQTFGLFGHPPAGLVAVPPNAQQFSPLIPGSANLTDVPERTLAGMVMLAAPGTLERRHDLAAMLVALAPGAPFTVLAPKDMGGARLAGELTRFGCAFEESAKRHHRICIGTRPADPEGLSEALAEGAPRRADTLDGLWSQPGIFSWNRLDPGSALLLQELPRLAGRGADFGCGIGVLAHGVLASDKVTALDLVDIDRRAIEAARRNVGDPRARFAWADVLALRDLKALDFVVMNPPFHDGGAEDRGLGQAFIRRAAEALRPGGHLWLTANRHLPYEAVLKPLFKSVRTAAEANGFKVFEARK
jgi:16S rRNA (guanine1207-N2)-methyltransferase